MNRNLIDTFLDLVSIDSPSTYEKDVIGYVLVRLKDMGMTVSIDEVGNIFAFSDRSGNPVLLCAHLDTVEPGRGVRPKISNGHIKSDGRTILGADNKAAVAAILLACEETPVIRRKNLEIIFSVREETSGGINEFDTTLIKSKTGLVADSGEPIGSIVLASPWIEDFEAGFFGREAHTSVPGEGINALIAEMSA